MLQRLAIMDISRHLYYVEDASRIVRSLFPPYLVSLIYVTGAINYYSNLQPSRKACCDAS
jgi:hypothetical protein